MKKTASSTSSKDEPSKPEVGLPAAALRASLEDLLRDYARPQLAAHGFKGILKVEIRGDRGGTFYLRGEQIVPSIGASEHPDLIFRGDRVSLDAILGGRLSIADAMIGGRVSIAGDLVEITRFKRAFARDVA
jgi:hypothetical protein